MHWSIHPSVGIALLLATIGLGAQGIYRCGNSYGQQPCAGGSTVATDPAPSAAEAAQARRGAAADARRADELERVRLQRDRNAPGAVVPGERSPAEADARDGKKAKAKNGEDPGRPPAPITAVGPRPPARPKPGR